MVATRAGRLRELGPRKRLCDKTTEGGRLLAILAASLAKVVGYQQHCSNNIQDENMNI